MGRAGRAPGRVGIGSMKVRVFEAAGEVVATLMLGYEGHRGWMNYLAAASGRRSQGWGSGGAGREPWPPRLHPLTPLTA